MHRYIGMALVLPLAVVGLVAAQSGSPSHRSTLTLQNEAWTAPDGPYRSVLTHMETEFKSGRSSDALVEEYKTIALQRPKDPIAQFGFVCAERAKAWTQTNGQDIPYTLITQLANADPGNVHEYTRYRYCMSDEVNLVLPLHEVLTVGNRLLQYDPKDEWVRYSMIDLLIGAKGGLPKALPYALNWVSKEPGNPKAHSTLALVYEDIWASDKAHRKAVAAESVLEYRKYLSLAPANASFRHNAEYLIKTISQQAGLSGG